MAETYRASGDSGRDILLMQKLVPLLDSLAGTMGELKVDRLTVLGQSDGGGTGGGSDERLAAKLLRYSEEIKAATGIDVPDMVKRRLGPTPS